MKPDRETDVAALRSIEACRICVEKCACDYCQACVQNGWKKPALVHASLCDNCANRVQKAMMNARVEALGHFERECLREIERGRAINAHPSKAMILRPDWFGVWDLAAVKLGAARERLEQGGTYDSTTPVE